MKTIQEKNFSKVKSIIQIPNLIENQLKSFQKLKDEMLDSVFREVFPIEDNAGNCTLEYLGSVVEEPKITPEEASLKNLTYSGVLKVRLRLINRETGEILESETFFGDFPYSTDSASFIVNGNERTVINQITRAPGMYVTRVLEKNGKYTYTIKVIPNDGDWLTFVSDSKGLLWLTLNLGKKKIPPTLLVKAMGGYSDDEILEMFNHHHYIQESLKKDTAKNQDEAMLDLFHILRPDEPRVIERAKKHFENLFVNPRRYDLSPLGRKKINEKLSLKERAVNKVLARDTNGYKKGDVVDEEFFENYNDDTLWILNAEEQEVMIRGIKPTLDNVLNIEDVIGAIDYAISADMGVANFDDIDHLGNRRVRLVGELLRNQFRIGLNRVERNIKEKLNVGANDGHKLTPQYLINVRPLMAVIKEFLGGSQLSQFVEQVNPYAELGHKRRISALGPGGFQKDRAGIEVRDVHYSHYGNMCPSETPEGANVGLITSLALYARINDYGLLETPYLKVDKKTAKTTETVEYMTADVAEKHFIAKADSVDNDGNFTSDRLTVRRKGEYPTVSKHEVDYIDVSPGQLVGVGIQLVPFLQHDDSTRAVMGANMQRQAVSLVNPDRPIVGTGMEKVISLNTNSSYIAEEDGVVKIANASELVVEYKNKGTKKYQLHRYKRTNADTSFTHRVRVTTGEKVKKGTVLVDSSSSDEGELALGKNALVGFMPWRGYNYEDAVVISQRLVKDDSFTNIVIKEYKVDVRETTNGDEELSTDIPQVSKYSRRFLDENGIVKIGSHVKGNDVLVGKRTPKGNEDSSPEDKILRNIFGDKSKNYRDGSLKMRHNKKGVVINVVRIRKEDMDELPSGVIEQVKVFVAEKRKIKEGDKVAGRHGNKGIIATVVPEEDMPYMEDGTPLDIVLNPLGVPSRMNIGQIMETHLGMAGRVLDKVYKTPVFDGASEEDILKELAEAGMPESGKFKLYDGITGEEIIGEVTVGVMYMLKLIHMVDDKMHARSTGPYSLVTQQPLGGKAQMGGQRFGEMEVWALEAYGAAHILREVLTVKSDDVIGRTELYESIVRDREMQIEGQTESLKVMLKELMSLGLDVKLEKEE